MASVKSDISLQIKNNLNRTATFSILGGTQDPSNGQANAKTIYEWDLTAESFANTTVVTIEASTIDNPVIINYEVQNQDGAVTDLETVVRLLNTLNLGVFNLDGNTIWIIDDINIFGNIEVLVSLSFDINVFVQEAYNYFDPLGKTSLVDFQAKYTSVIQQAVDTIPDFVDFVESQGWSLCYPTNASNIDLVRVTAGSIFLTSDTGGFLTTDEYTSGTSFNIGGFDNALLYAPDVNSFKTLQSLTFNAPLVPSNNAYIFKYLFEAPVFLSFSQNPAFNNGFQFIDPSYFPSPTTFGTHSFRMPPFGTNQLNLYGAEFPKLNIQAGNYNISASQSNQDIDLINVNSSIVFDTLGDSTSLSISYLVESNTSTIFVDFSSLSLLGDNQSIALQSTDTFQQQFELSSEFNTKFDYGGGLITPLTGKTLVIGCSAGGTGAFIQYADDITPLNLKVKNISFDESVTNNLPPIGTGGGQIGSVYGLLYTLRLNLADQLNLVAGREMEYFNNWFFELGTQTFLSQNSANTTGVFGNILTAGTNLFVLSGQGYYGYQALIDCGFTITTPVGAITSNIFTFTQKEGELLLVRTVSALGQSAFKVTSASKNQAEVVSTSSLFAIGTEVINFSAPALGEDNNSIFTSDPTLDCTSFYIGTNPPFTSVECMTTFLVGNGVFNTGIDLGSFTVNGLTITLPNHPTASGGDAYGLFQRDFSGLNGNNVSISLSIRYYRINLTKLANTLVTPYGSNALFNVGLNGFIPSIPEISFSFCEFGTSTPDNTSSPDPLGLLLPIGATCQNGIQFFNCSFNYANPPFIPDIKFNINDNGDVQQALLGTSTIQNTTFGTFGSDRIQLRTNYNGTGDSISSLTFQTLPQLQSVQLVNSATAVPLPCSLTFNGVVALTQIDFQNYNMNNLNLTSALPSVITMRVNDNDLNTVDLDDIIVTLDNNGLTGGTLDYSNQTGGASPSIGVSGLAYNNLIVKGWTVTGNVPI